jgi:hypothetical protein
MFRMTVLPPSSRLRCVVSGVGFVIQDIKRVTGLNGVWFLNEGHVVAYLVETLCYKPEGRGFDSQ